MSFTPPTLHDLKLYLQERECNVSIARDCDPKRNFFGYHLGKDQIFGKCLTTTGVNRAMGSRDYSIQTARDKAGLTNARAAIDIELPTKKLQELSKWLVAQCMKGAKGTHDIREVIYSPDGLVVWRFDNLTGINSKGGGDLSHTWHTHVSYYRDSEVRGKTEVYIPYFDVVSTPDPATGDNVNPDDVKQLQNLLNLLGARPLLVVDGNFGPKTKAALTAGLSMAQSIIGSLKTANQTIEAVREDVTPD